MSKFLVTVLILVVAASVACGDSSEELILATTTSTQDSGLLDVIVPAFEDQTDYEVKAIAVGSGQAIRLGQEGEADVILAHSPKAEEDMVAAGDGIEREAVMHNDFVLIGPEDDPANVAGAASAKDAFAAIAASGVTFISRGDESGTHTKELALWASAGVDPAGQSWYQETGQGMGATITVADERAAYTLSDRGTYLAQKDGLGLQVLSEGDAALYNNYHVIVVNPDKHSEANAEGARAFAEFITGSEGQQIISSFGAAQYGEPLFAPDAVVQTD